MIASILLLAKADSPLYIVLLEASRKSKDPNALIEPAENLFNAPCMATCLSVVALENKKITERQGNTTVNSVWSSGDYRNIFVLSSGDCRYSGVYHIGNISWYHLWSNHE